MINPGTTKYVLIKPRPAIAAVLAVTVISFLTPAAQSADSALVRPLWDERSDSLGCAPFGTPAVEGNKLFIVCGGIRAYAQDSGRELWHSEQGEYNPHKVVTAGGRVLVVEAAVSALDAQTGQKKWEFRPDANASLGRATTQGNRLYFGTSSHRLYAVRISDGKILWQTDLGQEWKYPAVVRGLAAAGRVLYATVEQWRTENGKQASGWLIALDAKTGRIFWRYSTGSGDQRRGLSSSPVVTPKLVLAGDYLSNAIEAIDRRTGREVWRFEGERGFVGFPEAPVIGGDKVYAASGDTYVYAIGLLTGRLIWRTKMPASNESYALCGTDLVVNYHGLAALDLRTGRIEQTLLQGTGEFVTSDFATLKGHFFIAGPKGVYGFDCGKPSQ
jgi:outer membrane protein assembly factor BamB